MEGKYQAGKLGMLVGRVEVVGVSRAETRGRIPARKERAAFESCILEDC